jgi:hypothetical protein
MTNKLTKTSEKQSVMVHSIPTRHRTGAGIKIVPIFDIAVLILDTCRPTACAMIHSPTFSE